MYESHPLLREPDPNTPLWRYMDFTKFVALLEARAIYFASLTSLDDPFEGVPPKSVIRQYWDVVGNKQGPEREAAIQHARANVELLVGMRRALHVSCWHANERESAAMWVQYIRSGEGIAIKSTFERFKRALSDGPPIVSGGLIQYVNFDDYVCPSGHFNIVEWAALKRQSFEHEREFRGVLLAPGIGPQGISVPTDIAALIQEVRVSPNATGWMFDLIGKVIARYGLEVPLIKSEVGIGPEYLAMPSQPL